MINALNYAAQAESALTVIANSLTGYQHSELDAWMCKSFAKLIKTAVHFVIPDDGAIFDDDLKGLSGITARLPYEAITVEYHVDGSKSRYCEDAPLHAKKRLVLAFEVNKHAFIEFQNRLRVADFGFIEKMPDDRFVQFFVMNEINGAWGPCCMSWLMPITWDYTTGGTYHIKPIIEPKSRIGIAGVPCPALPGQFLRISNKYGEEKALQLCVHDISGEIRAVLELCEALTCTNVTTAIVQNKNKTANVKREKNGKLPIYETKAIVIEVPKTAQHNSHGGHVSRNGPRQHLRRGHIRIMQGEKRVWVNSCVVGNIGNGRIEKSYVVSSV